MRYFLLIITLLTVPAFLSAQELIKIHFLYGSKPAKGYKDSESKAFGGIKGGHVNIEAGGRVLDFMPGNCPLFPDKKNPSGGYHINHGVYWDTSSSKWMTIEVPVSSIQFRELEILIDSFSKETPYDYAVFGMRCAAASYDVLSEIGLMKELPNGKNVAKNFYPKLLRKRMAKWAKKNNYRVIYHEGSERRKWEKDKGLI
jgi:hypothetical protein